MPKGDRRSTPSRYQIEFADGSDAVGPLPTQKAAVTEAKKRGYKPLVARVRNTCKGTLATGAPQTIPRLAKIGSGWVERWIARPQVGRLQT